MTIARTAARYERVTVTLVPESAEQALLQVPSTYNPTDRTYGWKTHERLHYMLVPTRISNREIRVDVFVEEKGKGRLQAKGIQTMVEHMMKARIATEWRGLRLGSVSRPTEVAPPAGTIVRGTIEEILGASFSR